jgi:hypothetical protein
MGFVSRPTGVSQPETLVAKLGGAAIERIEARQAHSRLEVRGCSLGWVDGFGAPAVRQYRNQNGYV